MTTLFRIAVVGTKGRHRRYVSGTPNEIELTGRDEALHWDKATAMILHKAINSEFERLGRSERFQVERAT